MHDPFMRDKFFLHFMKGAAGLIVITIIGNILFWGGVIYFALWALRHFGVI